MSSNYNDIENYCKDCDRSIYGAYHDCDINIENDGRYTSPGSPCYCKCRQGVGMVEKYPWQLDYTISIREAIKEIARWTGYLDTDMVTRIQTGLRKLPPAQQEIIHCKDCKYAEEADPKDSQDGYTCQFHRGSIWFSGSYCSWGDMRGESEEK